MLAAEAKDGEGDRNADEGTENAPEKCPEQNSEQHDEWRDRKRIAGHTRLNEATDHELYDVKAYEHAQNGRPGVELCHCQQRREQGCDERTDERDVVQNKGDYAPFDRKLQA